MLVTSFARGSGGAYGNYRAKVRFYHLNASKCIKRGVYLRNDVEDPSDDTGDFAVKPFRVVLPVSSGPLRFGIFGKFHPNYFYYTRLRFKQRSPSGFGIKPFRQRPLRTNNLTRRLVNGRVTIFFKIIFIGVHGGITNGISSREGNKGNLNGRGYVKRGLLCRKRHDLGGFVCS